LLSFSLLFWIFVGFISFLIFCLYVLVIDC
jgi:hypothetical protein